MEKKLNKIEEIEINEDVMLEELSDESLDSVDGGIAGWVIAGGIVVAVGAFAVGVYNGYQEAARN